ncbi:MAG: MerR family transcriptional regulator [Devosia sp.]|jgi:DNA-binding transcriptional MerR regulator|nr:MerR family transcriptional regulator [Devosia sp.]
MQIGELSERSGLSRDALRFYEKRGLIRARRRPNGYRHYPEATLFLLDYIRTAQRLGFTLAEIEAELPLLQQEGLTATRVEAILRGKIDVIDARIGDLQALRDDLAGRLSTVCPLIAAGH